MKTHEEIQKQIDWLKANKSKIPQQTAFGDDNHEKIEVIIEVLGEKMSEDDIQEKEDTEDWNSDQAEEARFVLEWLSGEEPLSPIDSWMPLVRG